MKLHVHRWRLDQRIAGRESKRCRCGARQLSCDDTQPIQVNVAVNHGPEASSADVARAVTAGIERATSAGIHIRGVS